MILPALSTARLRLRPLAPWDAAPMTEALNNLAVSRWLTVVPYPYTLADAEWFVNENIQGRAHSWSVSEGTRFVGVVGIGAEFGYWLAEPDWGKGFGFEAAQATVDYYFEDTDEDQLISNYFDGNIGSARILEKLGFENRGRRMMPIAALGTQTDSQMVELTRHRWESLRSPAN